MANSKNSKHLVNAEIPSDWEVKRLGDISQIKGRIGYRGYTVDDIVPMGAGAITMSPSNFKNGYLDYSDSTYISWFKYDESPEIQLANDDILLVKTGSTFGKTALVNNLIEKATINPQIVVIKNVKIDVKFLSYIIADNIIQKQINSVVVGGAIPTLSQENILNFIFPLPPLPEQKAIAKVLTTWDDAIAKTQALITKKELRKKWLMQNLLTGTKRLKGFDRNWNEYSLVDVAKFLNGKAYRQEELLEKGKYKVLRVGNFFTNSNWYFSDLELEDDKYVNEGDLMYAWSASFGPRFWKGEKTIYHYHIWKVIPTKMIVKNFLYYFLVFDTERIFNNKQGGTMFHVTKGDMEKRKIIVPSIEEQTAIAQVLQAVDKEILLLKIKTEKLKEQKKGLMQVLLTGKKRLKTNSE